VDIDDTTGHTVDAPINVIGAYSGSVAEGLAQGSYILNITADAAWTVTVTQPRNLVGETLPQTFSGSGQQAVGPFAAASGVRLQAQNSATNGGNFIVQVRGSDGSIQGVPFNVIGSFNGSTISNNLSDGPYWLDVDSDGSWSITASTVSSTAASTTTSPPPTTKTTTAVVSSTATSRAATTAASHSLAFTGEGPGLQTITLLGATLMLLGLISLVLADVPRRMVRRFAFFSPGSGDTAAARGAKVTPELPAREPVLDVGPREQLFIDVQDIAVLGSGERQSDSNASDGAPTVVAGELAPAVDDAEVVAGAATDAEAPAPEAPAPEALDPELEASAVSLVQPEPLVATLVEVLETDGDGDESGDGDGEPELTVDSIETADETLMPGVEQKPESEIDEIDDLEANGEPEQASAPTISQEADSALPDATTDIAPSGWYELSTGLRYWDGTNWTDHLAHRRYASDPSRPPLHDQGEPTAHDGPLPWQAHGPELLGWWL
jgi:hypothetical protein